MTLESTLESFHILSKSPDNSSKDEEQIPIIQRSRSYYEYYIHPLPRILYSPPVNFGMVTHGLYRSSFPQKENFTYLRKLGLKSVLYPSHFLSALLIKLGHWYKKNIHLRISHFWSLRGYNSFSFQSQRIKNPL
jgi:hypothetical protein